MDLPSRRQSLLVLRVAVEDGRAPRLRIHLRTARHVDLGYDGEAHFADVDAACDAVRAWLDTVAITTGELAPDY